MPLRQSARRFFRRAFFLLTLAAIPGAVLAQPKGDPARGATRAAACAACHGPDGGRPLAGLPALSGQQHDFLEQQLILIREGLREIPAMNGMLKNFSDRDLIDIAAYFSAAKPFSSGGVRDNARYSTGAALSQAMGCGSCHMKDYVGQRQIPRITNQREDYLIATLKAYRDDRRSGSDTSMNGVMYKAADADIAALAHYLSHQ